MPSNNFIQAQEFQLAGSGCSSSATTIVLKSFNDSYGNAISSGDLNTTNYGTLEPGTDREEIISFTGISSNADGTVNLTGVTRGLEAVTPYAADSALRKSHAGSTIFVLTNNPQLYRNFYQYADDLAIAGAPDSSSTAKGLVEMGTQAEVDAGDDSGSTSAPLAVLPSTIRAKAYHDYAVDSVGSDAYAITITPAITAYAAGQVFTFKAGAANTGAATLNVSGLGAKTIKKNVSEDLVTGDILLNQIVMVQYDGTNMQLLSAPAPTAVPIIRTYTANDTWTKPAGLRYAVIEVVGGGGGGGGSTTAGRAGGGGGGGGYSKEILAVGALGATEAVTVGAAGAAGVGTGGSGGAGGTSSFGTVAFLQATGGAGGVNSDSGDGGGGAGGIGSNGTINAAGGGGGTGTTAGLSGAGGNSFFGGGANGLGSTSNTVGVDGRAYGGGGSGAVSGGNDSAGGAGAAGVVIVTEYY